MERGLIARLAKAIGYPQEVPAEVGSFDFLVDGETVNISLVDGRARTPAAPHGDVSLLFQTVLTEDEEVAGRLVTYAAGRLLKEKSVLAWDPERRAVILWEAVKGTGEGEQRRSFESFCESVDWWRERVKESGVSNNSSGRFLLRP